MTKPMQFQVCPSHDHAVVAAIPAVREKPQPAVVSSVENPTSTANPQPKSPLF